jgi:KDO2-lipid IV(A) lauroyltransferase
MAAGRGVVIALPHIGSWEWGGAYLSRLGLPMTAVAERLEPEELFQFFLRQRSAMGIGVVPLDDGAVGDLSKVLASGGLVGLLCDRDLMGGGQPATLFGEPVTIPKGPATLALRSGAALFVGAVYSGPDGSHYAIVEGPLDTERTGGIRADVARVTEDVTRRLEGLISRTPDQWHVFQPIFTSPDRP